MANVLINPSSGILEFNQSLPGFSGLSSNLTGALRIEYNNQGGIILKSYSTGTLGIERFAVEGVNGRLFTIKDEPRTALFNINNDLGLPVLNLQDNYTVRLGDFSRNDFIISGNKIGIGTFPDAGNIKVSISGSLSASGAIFSENERVMIASSGQALNARIENLSGTLNISGTNILNRINNLSGSLNSSGMALVKSISSLSGTLNTSGANILTTINSTGNNLMQIIKDLSGVFNETGLNLLKNTETLSGQAFLTYGDQSGYGTKYFENLVVTGRLDMSNSDIRSSGIISKTIMTNTIEFLIDHSTSTTGTLANGAIEGYYKATFTGQDPLGGHRVDYYIPMYTGTFTPVIPN